MAKSSPTMSLPAKRILFNLDLFLKKASITRTPLAGNSGKRESGTAEAESLQKCNNAIKLAVKRRKIFRRVELFLQTIFL